MIRAGMIGTGSMAQAIVADFASAGLDLAAVAARDVERTGRFASAHGIESALTVDQLLDADLDLIYVATTHDSHADLATAALRSGHAVLVEKAFTMNTAEAEAVIAIARECDRFLMEAMWMRFTPAIRRVQALIAEGAIGDPRTVQASFGFILPPGDHRLRDPNLGGGTLLDQGVYPVALADLILGAPESVSVTGSLVDSQGAVLEVETEVGMLLGYGGGQQSVLATSLAADLPMTASIGGREGMIELRAPFWGSEEITVRRGRDAERISLPNEGRGYVPMLRAVKESLEIGRTQDPLCDHDATLRVMSVIDLVRAQLPG